MKNSHNQRLEYQHYLRLLEIPAPASEQPSCFAFSVPKAGSTMLFNMLEQLAPRAGLTYFSPEDRRFSLGMHISELPVGRGNMFVAKGYLYAGFRGFRGYSSPIVRDSRKILLVRHPSDTIVSRYFSLASSHIDPGSGGNLIDAFRTQQRKASELDIDSFARNSVQNVLKQHRAYVSILKDANIKIFRYEDIVYRKQDFLIEVLDHFGWSIPVEIVKETVSEFDQIPDDEDPRRHVRQVHPGNHRKHLSPETIAYLKVELSPVLRAFGYETCGATAHLALSTTNTAVDSGSS